MKHDKRQDYISKEDMYMMLAKVASLRSKDPNTQVGAVIVSNIHNNDRILSIGYNGFPNGCSDDEFPWNRDGSEEDTKYPYVVHAELNAILSFRGDTKALENSIIFTTLFPCHECAKAMIQVGIKTVYYDSNKYSDKPDFREAKRMFDAAGVKLIEYHISEFAIKSFNKYNPFYTTASWEQFNYNGGGIEGFKYCSNCGHSIREDMQKSKCPKCNANMVN